MKNPLTKRLPRELKSEFGKYLVIFLLLIISIDLFPVSLWQTEV